MKSGKVNFTFSSISKENCRYLAISFTETWLYSSGKVGPVSHFFSDLAAPQHADASTLGRALFDNEGFESWSSLHAVNTTSIFFVTTAFLGLLTCGASEEGTGGYSSVVNVTSISGIGRLSQDHVRLQSVTVVSADESWLFFIFIFRSDYTIVCV